MENKQESIQTFKQEFEKLRVWGLNEQEQKTLRELFFKLTKEEQKKVLQEYRDLKKEPEKSFFEWLKKQLGELKKDVERQNRLKGGFDELRKDFEKNEWLKQIFDLFNAYVETKLDKSFTPSQKDQIKLALFWVVEKKLNPAWLVEVTIQKYIKPLQDLIARFNSKEENEAEVKKEDFGKLSKSFDETFEKLGISGLASFVDDKIDKINKKKSTSFDSVIVIIDPKNKWKITKETIKKDTEKLAKQLESWKQSWEQIKKSLKKLPMWIGETIMGFLRDIAKKYPILWFIFSLFFGADFLSEASEEKEKSMQGLIKLKKENPEILKNIDIKELQKLDPKKLEKFYKYLDSKDIDYSKDSFWEELLTWKTKDKKILEVYELLKNKDWKILEKTEKLEDLVKKLNSLEELETAREAQKVKEHNKKVEEQQKQIQAQVQKQKQAQAVLVAVASAKTKEERETIIKENKVVIKEAWIKPEEVQEPAKVEAVIKKVETEVQQAETQVQELEAKKEKTFEEYLKEWKIKLWDKLESISVDEQNHILQIGENKYKVEIKAYWVDFLEQISFKDWIIAIVANWTKKVFPPWEVKWLLQRLLAKWTINDKIPWKPAKLIIEKV